MQQVLTSPHGDILLKSVQTKSTTDEFGDFYNCVRKDN